MNGLFFDRVFLERQFLPEAVIMDGASITGRFKKPGIALRWGIFE
jgi:hypothetical protein